MPTLSPCFRVHIPLQLRAHEQCSIGSMESYYDAVHDRQVVNKYADECYLPINKIIAHAIERTGRRFKLAFSISGTTLELLSTYRVDVIESFRELIQTGCVELLAETYYNSLSWLYSKASFRKQVSMHSDIINELFNVKPVVFCNTGLIYDNTLASYVAEMGYKGIICEGVDSILLGRTANQLYTTPGVDDIGLLLRNASLSDDIAFRFDDTHWNEQPLTADKYASWIHSHGKDSHINLFLDYETFGIHKKPSSGILEFLEHLPEAILKDDNWHFSTPSEMISSGASRDIYDVPKTISWKGRELEYCVWSENMMQNNMLKKIYSLENIVLSNGGEDTWRKWCQLQAADHFYAMSETNSEAESAYRNYVNIITDFEIKLIKRELSISGKQYASYQLIY